MTEGEKPLESVPFSYKGSLSANGRGDMQLGLPVSQTNTKRTVCECCIEFPGLFCRQTSATVASELIKYVLLQREQIPQRFDLIHFKQSRQANVGGLPRPANVLNLSSQKDDDATRSECDSDTDTSRPCRRLQPLFILRKTPQQTGSGSSLLKPSVKKQLQSYTTATEIFTQLGNEFTNSIFPIKQLVFILGSSLVTPKETYLLTYPANTLEGTNLSTEEVKKSFFKQLVTSDFIESFGDKSISSLQKLFVLIQTSRQSDIKWFVPAPRFSIPHRGKLYHIKLANNSIGETSVIVSDQDSSLDISGVVAMETSILNTSSPGVTPCKKKRLELSFEELCDHDNDIWYQAPVIFKGFKY